MAFCECNCGPDTVADVIQWNTCLRGGCPHVRCTDHVFEGWRVLDGGLGGERVCRNCGIGAMAHSLATLP